VELKMYFRNVCGQADLETINLKLFGEALDYPKNGKKPRRGVTYVNRLFFYMIA
jgi:hypothetical protein